MNMYAFDHWRFENFLFVLALLIFISYRIAKRTGIISGIASFYTFFSATFIYALSNVRYGQTFQYMMNTVAARAFTQSLVSVFAIFIIEDTSIMWFLFECASHINSVLMLFGSGVTKILSFNATFAAITVPLIFFKPNKANDNRLWVNLILIIPLILPIAAILVAGGSTPIFTLIAGFLGVSIAMRKWKLSIAAILIPLFVGLFREKDQLLNTNDRADHWKAIMEWWWSHPTKPPFAIEYYKADDWMKKIIGTGSGTFEWFGPIIERRASNAYNFLHNEYLQILFEQGFVGIIIFMILLILVLKKSFKTPWLFGTICAISVSMLTQFPLRFMITQLFVLLAFREALWKKNRS